MCIIYIHICVCMCVCARVIYMYISIYIYPSIHSSTHPSAYLTTSPIDFFNLIQVGHSLHSSLDSAAARSLPLTTPASSSASQKLGPRCTASSLALGRHKPTPLMVTSLGSRGSKMPRAAPIVVDWQSLRIWVNLHALHHRHYKYATSTLVHDFPSTLRHQVNSSSSDPWILSVNTQEEKSETTSSVQVL